MTKQKGILHMRMLWVILSVALIFVVAMTTAGAIDLSEPDYIISGIHIDDAAADEIAVDKYYEALESGDGNYTETQLDGQSGGEDASGVKPPVLPVTPTPAPVATLPPSPDPEATPVPTLTEGEYEEVFPEAEYDVTPILPNGNITIT